MKTSLDYAEERFSNGQMPEALGCVIAYLRAEQSSHAAKGERECGDESFLRRAAKHMMQHIDEVAADDESASCGICGLGCGKHDEEMPCGVLASALRESAKAEPHGGGKRFVSGSHVHRHYGVEESPTPDADGGEEDGIGEWRNLRTEARVALGGNYCMVDGALTEEELETLDRVEYSLGEAVKVGRKESAEALGRAEAQSVEFERMLQSEREVGGQQIRELRERAEKAEARLAAWEKWAVTVGEIRQRGRIIADLLPLDNGVRKIAHAAFHELDVPTPGYPDGEAEARAREGR